MKTIAWRAFFTEGRTFSAKSNLVEVFRRLPEMGFLSLVLYHDEIRPDGHHYRTIVDGGDHYVAFNGAEFKSVNTSIRKLNKEHPGCIIKLGTEIPREDFMVVNSLAMSAIELP